MAKIKGWEKVRNRSFIGMWKSTEGDIIFISKQSANNYVVIFEGSRGKTQKILNPRSKIGPNLFFPKPFSRRQAMMFAINYMKKHPKG